MKTRTEIYYFSGTGNSLAVAKDLAARTGGEIIAIASLLELPSVHTSAEAVGIVFPVYYAGPPAIINDFLRKLEMMGKPYVFGVATFGGSAGLSFAMLKETAANRGYAFDAFFGIHMPQNAFKKPWEKTKKVIARAEKRTEWVADAILKRKSGVMSDSIALELMMKPFSRMIRKASRKAIAGFANASPDLEFDTLIRRADNAFEATEDCNACGLCARVCPTQNIQIEGGRPAWQNHCENCLACAHWCPQKAIRGGVINDYYYRHLDLEPEDMDAQKGEE